MSKTTATVELDVGELPPLPVRWRWGRVEDAASTEKNAIVDGPFGSNLKLSDYIAPPGVPVLTTANLRGDYGPTSVRYISQTKFEDLRRSEVRGGDILVAKIGSCGVTGVYPDGMPSAIIPANLLKMTVRPEVSRRFVFYYFNSPTFSRFLQKIVTATAQPAFNVTKFRKLPIPLVSRQEQDAIVAEIERQFTRLEAGVVGLRRVQANLKRYRAAVLKAACEGKLVPTEACLRQAERGRQAELARGSGRSYETGAQLLARILTERRQKWTGRGKYKEPAASATTKLAALPDGYTWATFGQLCRVQGGFAFKSGDYVKEGIPLVRISNLVNGRVQLSEDTVFLPESFASEYAEFRLRKGDVVIAMSGATTGKMATMEEDTRALLNQRVGRFVLSSASLCSGKFISFLVEQVSQKVLKDAYGAAQPNISPTEIEAMPVPLPPLAEQERIVAEVERRLSAVEELEAVVAANFHRATRLRQAILQRAFSGGLLESEYRERDHDDENRAKNEECI